jgi:hypothetical protein
MVSRSPRGAFASRIPLVLVLLALLLSTAAATAVAAPVLPGSGGIHGIVTAANGGANVPFVIVQLYQWTGSEWLVTGDPAWTESTGYYEFVGIPDGTYRVRCQDMATLPFYAAATYTAPGDPLKTFVGAGASVTVTGPSWTTCNMKMRDGINLDIRVRRWGTVSGDPFPNISVSWSLEGEGEGAGGATNTGVAGTSAVIKGMPGGRYRIQVSDVSGTYEPSFYGMGTGTDYVDMPDGGNAMAMVYMRLLPTLTPAVYEGWQSGPVTVGFSLYDPDSTVGSTEYVADGVVNPWTTGATTVFSAEGLHTVQGRCVTTYPWKGPVTTKTVRIDNTPPHTTSNAGAISQTTLQLAYTDNLAGVLNCWYTLDGGPPTSYSVPVAITLGPHAVTWWSQDRAGSFETAHAGTIVGGSATSVRKPAGGSSVRARRSLTFSGKLSRVANHKRLTLLAYKFNGVEWVLTRTKSVVTHTPRRGMATYRGAIKFTSKGRWKVVARYEGDAAWAPAESAPKYVTVR